MKSTAFLFALLIVAAATAHPLAASDQRTVATGALGTGTVTAWQRGSELGVTIDKRALASLPARETQVDLLSDVAPFRLIEVDWNPLGHPPKGVYDKPHLDVHFYVISKKERDAIAFGAPGRTKKPDATLVPAGYVSDGTVVPQMGMHFVAAGAPEFHGTPFTCTQLIGYNNGHLAFIETMFTLAFVRAHGSYKQPVAQPPHAPVTLPQTLAVTSNEAGGYNVVVTR